MYQKIKEYFEVHKQEMLDDIMAAIRIPSVNGPEKPGMPFGEENAKVLAFAASLAKELGLKAEVLENKVVVIDLTACRAGYSGPFGRGARRRRLDCHRTVCAGYQRRTTVWKRFFRR